LGGTITAVLLTPLKADPRRKNLQQIRLKSWICSTELPPVFAERFGNLELSSVRAQPEIMGNTIPGICLAPIQFCFSQCQIESVLSVFSWALRG
jgi:hypothetical protein